MMEFLNKAPPWVIVVLLLGSGGGGVSLGNLIGGDIKKEIKIVVEKIIALDRKLDGITWRVNSHTDRLNGNITKNREQDAKLEDLKTRIVILDAMSTFNPRERINGE